ncbi:MAG: carboxypeptidase regulatory-like domain-containing protein [Candidatus Hydrogenedentes bacterium]|nr:carboxypeptidase regulatory-like domain-containing protein [Candidatus Hydrogenedentota bacterium]
MKKDQAAVKQVFKGRPDAFRHIIEKYQPVVCAVALAQSGHAVVADKAVVATFKAAFERLQSITDAKRLPHWLCALAHKEVEILTGNRGPDLLKPRDRDPSAKLADLVWLQNELVEPLFEEMGPFSLQERKGLLLNVLCGADAGEIAAYLKIETREAQEDLARTRENVEKKLLKEIAGALAPEINSKERMVHVMREVAGEKAALKAARETRLGRQRHALLPALLVLAAAAAVVAIGGHFAYRVFLPNPPAPGVRTAQPATGDTAAGPPVLEGSGVPETPVVLPTNYVLRGRVGDSRFGDGIPGLVVSAGELRAETDPYGAFEIQGVTRGEHQVSIACGGAEISTGHRLHTERRNPRIDIQVDDRISLRFKLNGRVTDANTGQAIRDFEVAACKGAPQMLQPYLIREFRGQSHPEGLLREQFQTLGEYTVYVRATGYAALPLTFSITESWDDNSLFEFRLFRAATISGKVYGPNELTVSGVMVMPRQGTPEGTGKGVIEYMRTDTRGEFNLHGLPIGVNWLLLDHRTHGTGRAVVVTEPGKVAEVKIQLPRKGSLAGDIVVAGRPAKFADFRVSNPSVPGSRTVEPLYNAPGQYEVLRLPPGEVTVVARVAPEPGAPWFDRVFEQKGVIDQGRVCWMDFYYAQGPFSLAGSVSRRGAAPRSAFVEVALFRGENAVDRLLLDIGSSGSYQCGGLPSGKGEVTVYTTDKAVSKQDFAAAKGGMERFSKPFEFVDARQIQLDLAF